MKWAFITIALAVATLLCALRAASLWWQASRGKPRAIKHVTGSKAHAVQLEGEAAGASLLNSKAALWSGGTAFLSALTAIWGAMRPFF